VQLDAIATMAKVREKHWKNTKAIVERITGAQNAQRPHERCKSNQRKLSLKLPSRDEDMNCTSCQISALESASGGHACTSHCNCQRKENDSLDVSHQQGSASTVHEQQRRQSSISSGSSRSGTLQGEFISSPRADLEQLEGTWICCNADDQVATWLLTLDITSRLVIDGTGDVLLLKPGMDGHMLLEGGQLVRHGRYLCRIGRGGVVLRYLKRDALEG